MNLSGRYTYKAIYTKEEFLRKFLLKLAKVKDVTPDLLESDFGEVKLNYKRFYLATGSAECNYTCTIGYYKGQETYWRTQSDTYQDYYKTVVNSDGVVDKEAGINIGPFLDFFKKEEGEDMACDDEVKNCIIDGARRSLESNVKYFAEWKLPSNHKNFSGTARAEVEQVYLLIIPYYEISYTYKGTKNTVEFCVCRDFEVELIDEERTKLEYALVDSVKLAKKKVLGLTICRNVAWLLLLVLPYLSYFMAAMEIFPITVSLLIGVGDFILAVALTIVRSKLYKKIKYEYDSENHRSGYAAIQERRKQVYPLLEKLLAKKGLAPVTFEDLNQKEE